MMFFLGGGALLVVSIVSMCMLIVSVHILSALTSYFLYGHPVMVDCCQAVFFMFKIHQPLDLCRDSVTSQYPILQISMCIQFLFMYYSMQATEYLSKTACVHQVSCHKSIE